jgi:hypothetical protein
MRVIGAGFGRTGTLSLKVALEELGFGPCYHMTEVFDKPHHLKLWEAAARGDPIDWRKLFAGYQAAVDWPTCAFYEQLMHVYPDARIILTVRDPDQWYESTRNTIYRVRKQSSASPIARTIFPFLSIIAPKLPHTIRMINAIVWQGTFNGNFENKQHAITVFKRHIAEVRKHVPNERLLVYDVAAGWEPLCKFLGVAVPTDKPFPHLNDTNAFQKMIRRRLLRAIATPAATAALVTLALLTVLQRNSKLVRRLPDALPTSIPQSSVQQ